MKSLVQFRCRFRPSINVHWTIIFKTTLKTGISNFYFKFSANWGVRVYVHFFRWKKLIRISLRNKCALWHIKLEKKKNFFTEKFWGLHLKKIVCSDTNKIFFSATKLGIFSLEPSHFLWLPEAYSTKVTLIYCDCQPFTIILPIYIFLQVVNENEKKKGFEVCDWIKNGTYILVYVPVLKFL